MRRASGQLAEAPTLCVVGRGWAENPPLLTTWHIPEHVRFSGGGCCEGFRPYKETKTNACEHGCAQDDDYYVMAMMMMMRSVDGWEVEPHQ